MAIAALPPLNGFAGEFLLYLGAYAAIGAQRGAAFAATLIIGGLALVGGLTAACFARLFGIAFLGAPRSESALRAHEPGRPMQGSVVALALACVVLGLSAPLVVKYLGSAIALTTALPLETVQAELSRGVAALWSMVFFAVGFIALVGALLILRGRLLSARRVVEADTWGCGYAAPSARMQYTGASFSQPLTSLFASLLGTQYESVPPEGLFPTSASFASHTPDRLRESFYGPVFGAFGRALARFRWLQHGQVQLYVLYIAVTLVTLLLRKVVAG
jgi:NADH:ubiquinone oxidoreductase subunit 5 (subunit L)/multisubunit Na+/H+ antiporter MnhA subunit